MQVALPGVVTLADDDTNSILFMTEVSVKSRRMAVTSNCVNEKEFFFNWSHLVAKFLTKSRRVLWWLNFQQMHVAPPGD